LTALVVFSPARAAPENAEKAAPEKAEPGEAGAGGHGHAGPKDPFAPVLDLTIWSSVVFILLFLILRAFAWKPILEGLHKREHASHEAQEQAKKDREEAARLREQLQVELNKAAEQVRSMLDEARRDAQATTDDMLAKARGEIQAERQRLRRELDAASDAAKQ